MKKKKITHTDKSYERIKKMNYFVHYYDDYPNVGGIGLKKCETLDKVVEFIKGRLEEDPSGRSIRDYTVIYGKELKREDWPKEIY
jgi:hypothetical protein